MGGIHLACDTESLSCFCADIAEGTKIVFSKFADRAPERSITVTQKQDVAVTPPTLEGEPTSPPTGDTPHKPTTTSPKSSPTVSPKKGVTSIESSPKSAKFSPPTVTKSSLPKTPLSDEKQSPVQPPAMKTPAAAAVKQAWTKNMDSAPVPMGDEGEASGRHDKLVEGVGGGVSAEGGPSGGDLVAQGEGAPDMTVEDIETSETPKSTASKEPVYQLTAEEVFSTPEAPEQVSTLTFPNQ